SLTLALVAACGGQAAAPPARPPASPGAASVTVRAVERRFVLPARWPEGWVAVTLLDDGGQPHQLQLARLRPGGSAGDVRADFAAGRPAAAFARLALTGGPDTVEPGFGQRVTVWLVQGAYVAMDLALGPDGVQNAAEGMVAPFAVEGAEVGDQP